jgi:hypothetical protein
MLSEITSESTRICYAYSLALKKPTTFEAHQGNTPAKLENVRITHTFIPIHHPNPQLSPLL